MPKAEDGAGTRSELLAPHLHVSTNPETLRTLSVWVFVGLHCTDVTG